MGMAHHQVSSRGKPGQEFKLTRVQRYSLRGVRMITTVGRHAILAADVEDDLPVTLPATSGQVRAL